MTGAIYIEISTEILRRYPAGHSPVRIHIVDTANISRGVHCDDVRIHRADDDIGSDNAVVVDGLAIEFEDSRRSDIVVVRVGDGTRHRKTIAALDWNSGVIYLRGVVYGAFPVLRNLQRDLRHRSPARLERRFDVGNCDDTSGIRILVAIPRRAVADADLRGDIESLAEDEDDSVAEFVSLVRKIYRGDNIVRDHGSIRDVYQIRREFYLCERD